LKKLSIKGKVRRRTRNGITLQITEKDYKKLKKLFKKRTR
jgi:hypothetical protein